MTVQVIDFPSVFTKVHLDYVEQYVVKTARQIFGGRLRDIILYGSYARGDYREWSDVDILVIADVSNEEAIRLDNELADALSDLNYSMNLLLSIIVVPFSRFKYLENHYPFYINVRKEGISLCLMSNT